MAFIDPRKKPERDIEHRERHVLVHDCDLAERIVKLLYDEESSDVTLIVDGEHIPAHRAILAVSSDYFRSLLKGNMKESSESEVTLQGVPLRGLKLLMKYIYTGQFNCEGLDQDTMLEILEVAHLHGFLELQAAICRNLAESLSSETVFSILNKAQFLHIPLLEGACRRFMIEHPNEILESATFCQQPAPTLCELLSRDDFCVDEIEIFRFVERWCAERPNDKSIPEMLGTIRLPLVSVNDLLTTVKNSGLFTRDRVFEAIEVKECRPADVAHRGAVIFNENLATSTHGAKRLIARRRETLNDESAYTSVPLLPYESLFLAQEGLTLALNKTYVVNQIVVETGEFCAPASFNFSTSMDLVNWRLLAVRRVHGLALEINIEPQLIRYIKITGDNRVAGYRMARFGVFYRQESW